MLQEKIKELRLKKKWTQEELAEQLNVTRQTISKWEQGINEPDIATIQKLSSLFEVSIEVLLGKEDSFQKNNSQTLIKITNLISIAIFIICSLALLIIIIFLKDEIPMHWNLQGEVDRYGSKWEWVLGLLYFGIMFISDLVGVHFIKKEKKYKTILLELWLVKVVFWICQIVFLLLFLIANIPFLEKNIGFPIINALFYSILLPLFLFSHPKIASQNHFYGVRTSFTLENQQAWDKINSFSSYVLTFTCFLTIAFNLCIHDFLLNLLSCHFIVIAFVIIFIYHYIVKRNYQKKNK